MLVQIYNFIMSKLRVRCILAAIFRHFFYVGNVSLCLMLSGLKYFLCMQCQKDPFTQRCGRHSYIERRNQIKKTKKSCSMTDGKSFTQCVVQREQRATETETDSKNRETYIGFTENEFKHISLHKSALQVINKRTATTLSPHVWKLK